MHCVISIPYLHGSANLHMHMASHAATRDAKVWFDNNHQSTLHLRHAPQSRLAAKFSNYTPSTCPRQVKIKPGSLWSDPRVLASWDPMVIHPYPCPPPPCPDTHSPTAWNEWYHRHCGLRPATPSARRGRSTSRHRSPSPAQSSSRH